MCGERWEVQVVLPDFFLSIRLSHGNRCCKPLFCRFKPSLLSLFSTSAIVQGTPWAITYFQKGMTESIYNISDSGAVPWNQGLSELCPPCVVNPAFWLTLQRGLFCSYLTIHLTIRPDLPEESPIYSTDPSHGNQDSGRQGAPSLVLTECQNQLSSGLFYKTIYRISPKSVSKRVPELHSDC